jgi:hypothetical protein
MKALLAVSIVFLGGAILWVVSGQVGPAISSAVKGFGGLVGQIGAVAGSPKPTEGPTIADAPSIEDPDQPYTNQDKMDITVNVPSAVTGLDGYTVRLYVTLADKDPQLIVEEPVGAVSVQVLAGVGLASGRNDMQAAIMGPGGESERSAVTTWILDQSKPKVSVISPKNNAQVKKSVVTVKGKSQAGAEIRIQNAANGAISTAVTGKDNLWETTLAIADGSNAITVTATDPAGNENATKLTLRKGSGRVTASLTSSAYRFKSSKLPKTIKLTVAVTGPDGRRAAGATALFTISVPGLEAIVSGEVPTNNSGVASFTTTIPAGATPGGGLATVLVAIGDGTVTDRQVLTITK